jgi:hypothetical protein
MQKIEINRNSWHYWLVRTVNDYYPSSSKPNDFCTYLRKVIGGLFLVVMLLSSSLVLLSSVLYAIGWGMFHSFDYSKASPFVVVGVISLFIIGIFAVLYGLIFLHVHIKDKRRMKAEIAEPKQPSFISTAISSIRHKFCAVIEIKD